MNTPRKRIVLAYVVFLSVLALFFFLIVGYAISQGHISGYTDLFTRAADREERFWIRMAFVALGNLFVFSTLVFLVLLVFVKKEK